MRVGLMEVTADALLELLKLPRGTRIVDMRSTKFERAVGPCGPSLELIIESDELPEITEGCPVPIVNPLWEERFHSTTHFVGWR